VKKINNTEPAVIIDQLIKSEGVKAEGIRVGALAIKKMRVRTPTL